MSSVCTEIAQVLKAYSSSSPELLNLENGQLILILSKNASGWWLGELQVSLTASTILRLIGQWAAFYITCMWRRLFSCIAAIKKCGLNNIMRKLENDAA